MTAVLILLKLLLLLLIPTFQTFLAVAVELLLADEAALARLLKVDVLANDLTLILM
jgi:hypothetical protein